MQHFIICLQAKQVIKHNLGDPDRELAIYERFAAGSFAGAFSQSMIYPLEVSLWL